MDFRDFFEKNYNALYCFAFRMLGRREAAEDCVQEAFARMAESGAQPLQGDAARRFLFVVTRNLCLDHFRKHPHGMELPLDKIPEPASPDSNPRMKAQRNEREHLIKQAVLELPPELREALVLRVYENMSYAEIGKITGSPAGTVKSRIARAREKLRTSLKPLLEETK